MLNVLGEDEEMEKDDAGEDAQVMGLLERVGELIIDGPKDGIA